MENLVLEFPKIYKMKSTHLIFISLQVKFSSALEKILLEGV